MKKISKLYMKCFFINSKESNSEKYYNVLDRWCILLCNYVSKFLWRGFRFAREGGIAPHIRNKKEKCFDLSKIRLNVNML